MAVTDLSKTPGFTPLASRGLGASPAPLSLTDGHPPSSGPDARGGGNRVRVAQASLAEQVFQPRNEGMSLMDALRTYAPGRDPYEVAEEAFGDAIRQAGHEPNYFTLSMGKIKDVPQEHRAEAAERLARTIGYQGLANPAVPPSSIPPRPTRAEAESVVPGATPDAARVVSATSPRAFQARVHDANQTFTFNANDGSNIQDVSGQYSDRWNFGTLKGNSLVIHHTGGRGTVDGVVQTFTDRGFPAHFVIDREGEITRVLRDDQKGQHTRPSEINDVTNSNSWGVEIIARNDEDVTPAQVQASLDLTSYLHNQYDMPLDRVFGHGEINSHKQETEGMTVTSAYRSALPHLPSHGLTPQQQAVSGLPSMSEAGAMPGFSSVLSFGRRPPSMSGVGVMPGFSAVSSFGQVPSAPPSMSGVGVMPGFSSVSSFKRNTPTARGRGAPVKLSSGTTVNSGTTWSTGGYTYKANPNGSVTNVDTGVTRGGDRGGKQSWFEKVSNPSSSRRRPRGGSSGVPGKGK